jgi:metal-responsive CopG/Arc/MetJ family transcriptional regulator
MARELKRLNTNMPLELVGRVDRYAKKLSINRSAAINVLVSLALDSQEAVGTLGDVVKLVKNEQAKKITE